MSIATSLKKTSARIQAAVTGADPGTDLLDTLKEEHEEVTALLKQMADSDSGPARKALLKKIKAALVPHARAEEKVLYDAIIGSKEKSARQDGEEGYLEHRLADRMLATLGKIRNAASPEFGAAAKVLKELIAHHIKEEESAVWSDARKQFSAEERVAMNRKYLAAKKAVRLPN